jgi:hypothetical protein
MKRNPAPPPRLAAFAFTLLFAFTPLVLPRLQAFDENPDLDNETLRYAYITIEAQTFELDKTRLASLLHNREIGSDSTDLRDKIQALVDSGDATLETHLTVRGRSGQRSKSESIEELIYPTEPDEHGFPNAFETRNVGATLEVDPVLAPDQQIIDLNIAFEIVEHVGDELHEFDLPDSAEKGSIRMPTFYARKITTALSMRNRSYVFLGILGARSDPKDVSGRGTIVFVRASTGS